MSKEHFWPDWMRSLLSREVANSHISEVRTSQFKEPPVLTKRQERQGPVSSKRIRVVCKTCNNGWMSQLESEAKPILLSLINSGRKVLSQRETSILARWAVTKAVVGEHAEPGTALTPPLDRENIRIGGQIPSYFRVYLSRHLTESTAAYLRHSATISFSRSGPNPPLESGISRNIQIISFVVGELFFCVFAARADGGDIDEIFRPGSMVRIFPFHHEEFALLPELPQAALADIAGRLEDVISLPNVKYGGPLP